MEPITLILSSLTAGAAAASEDIATDAVKNLYQGIKALIRKRFKGDSEAELILDKYEKKPEVWKEPLKEELHRIGADQDKEIIESAQQLMVQVSPKFSQSKYNIQIGENSQGTNIGDNLTITQIFGDNKKKLNLEIT